MKLAFSTLGCPGWSWNEIYATAKDLGLSGIEIRGIENELNPAKVKPLLPENSEKTIADLKRAGLEIPILTSSAILSIPAKETSSMQEAKECILLAGEMGIPFVRVLGDEGPAPQNPVDLDRVKELYLVLCSFAADLHVSILLETNGVLADSTVMAQFMKDINCPNAGVLWDVHHPFRYFHETPDMTVENIGPYIRYLHIKDSVQQQGKTVYRMLGYGDVPVLDALKAAKQVGFDGTVSLEWVKRWNPDLQEPGVVFSHYQSYMSYLLRQL